MKKLFLLMLLCATISENYAQVSSAYKTQVESIFQVNRSYVTTGLLQDYGIFYTNVEKFNGVHSTEAIILIIFTNSQPLTNDSQRNYTR